MEKFKSNSEKIISLYKFIAEFCKIKNKIIVNDNSYIWNCKLKDIQNDTENINILYKDVVETENEDSENDNELDYILKVHKPEFIKCPAPNTLLLKWLSPEWDNYKKDLVIKEKIEKNNNITNEIEVECFSDDKNREQLLNNWINERNIWIEKQKKIEITRTFFIELYKQYNDLKSESERIEIIVANGYLKDTENTDIYHPILTKRLEMKFDASENTIYIMNTNSKSEIYTELFQIMNDINIDSLASLNSELAQFDYHPLDRNNAKDFLKIFTNKISSKSKFVEINEKIDVNNRILIFDQPVFIVRKRLDGTIKAIEQIIKNIENDGYIPSHLLDLVTGGIQENPIEETENIDELLAKAGGESIEFLLTKEANKEQLEIAKRIDMYNAVLVQGPPGTGKTHTIANLIGNFLANGKSVLVTSHTKKALSVLKEKLPTNIQSLCVSVLDESNEDMEKSIDGITEYMSKYTSFELSKQKEELKQQRIKIIEELSKTRKKMYDILNTEYATIILNGEEISPSEAAKFILKNKNELNYINGNVIPFSPLPLTMDELSILYSSNNKINKFEEKELNYKLPNPNTLMKPKIFNEKLEKISELLDKIKSLATQKKWTINIDNDILFETEFGKFYVPDLTKENLNNLNEFLSKYNQINEWELMICTDGKKGPSYKNRWNNLVIKINEANSLNESIINTYLGKYLTLSDEELINNKNTIEKLNNILSKSKKVNKLTLMMNSDITRIYGLNIINNKKIENKVDCEFLLKKIELITLRNEISTIWNELLSKYGVSIFSDLDKEEPEKLAQKYIEKIEFNLNWYDNEYSKLIKMLEMCMIPIDFIFNTNTLDSDAEHIKKIFNSLYNILPSIVAACLTKVEISEINRDIYNIVDILDDNLLINSELCINLKTALINNDSDKYLSYFKELESMYKKYELLNKRNTLLEKLELVAPIWASDIKLRNGIHGENIYPENIKDAWKYKQLNHILNDLTKDSLEELQNKSKKLSSDYRSITEEYAVTSAWFELLSKTECNIDLKQALKGWELTIKKIGKGTGKNAAKHKEKARNLMAKCQNAVPCWIMPINKAIESLKPGDNLFDVIIIDEASQSDISSLAITYLGKKMIIVGDDKQVSPLAIGTDLDKINAIEQIYIKDKIPNSHLYGSKTSLYDIAATTFHPLMLREHFRCVPEIIGFSNMLSYDYKIKPLRDQGKSKLLPPFINYRVDGFREGKINKMEAETIISLIKSCLTMEEYNNKTFGIISLKGDEQVKLIQSLLFKYIEPIDIENRKILVGNASNFQGDERDIIFLSMIDSNENNDAPLSLASNGADDSTKKRYNVAVSRAKDQLWVINSLNAATDLKPNDIRKKLLDYSSDPTAFNNKLEEIKKKSDSIFEEQVAKTLVSRGFNIIQQYPVGAYKLDIVVTSENEKVVIECDGEKYHSGEDKIREDMQRQTILERIGWRFIRIRGSQYFRNPDKEMENVISQLHSLNINPSEIKITTEKRTSSLVENIKIKSHEILEEIRSGKESNISSIISEKNIIECINKNTISKDLRDYITYTQDMTDITENHNILVEQANEFGESQFKYMVLYSLNVSRKDIAEYFNVAYDTVKKSLQSISNKKNYNSIDEYLETFKNTYSNTLMYKKIVNEYYDDKISLKV